MRINESGRSMIEMLGVLAIIGVLSVGGIAGYTKAMNKYRTNKVIDQVTMIVTNIRTLYAMQRNYDGLTTATALNMGVIPDELGSTANALQYGNPYNGSVVIANEKSGQEGSDGKNRAFSVAVNGLTREACVALATGDWGSGHSAGLIAIKVAGSTQSGVGDSVVLGAGGAPCTGSGGTACAGDTSGIGIPMPVTTAASQCTCGTSNTCSVAWKYF